MARFDIISKDGSTIRYSGEPRYSGSYMNTGVLEFQEINTLYPIQWEVGDYVDYPRTGLRYKLYSIPEPTKQSRPGTYGAAFVYSNVRLYDATKELDIAPFRDIVPEDNEIHFSTRPEVSTYEDIYGIARRIQACVNELYPGRWTIGVLDTEDSELVSRFEETKEFSISQGTCLGALSQIYDLWKGIGWTYRYDSASDKNIIVIGGSNIRTEDNTTQRFAYGKGNGLLSIRKGAANEDEFATRLYVYGSERNLPARYYNGFDILNAESVDIVNLMIPISKWGNTGGIPDARKAYVQAEDPIVEKYGLIPRSIYFDGRENEEIYPSIVGLTCSKVRKAMIDAGQGDSKYLPEDSSERIDKVISAFGWTDGSKEDIESLNTFDMHIRTLGFDIVAQGALTAEGHATISMKSGKCAGREFKVRNYYLDDRGVSQIELEKLWDDSLGMSFPNKYYPIEEGDEFVLLDIPMPDYYITLASERLYEAAVKMLSDYTRVSAFYEPSLDPITIKEEGIILREGMYMQVYDENIVDTEDNSDYVLIEEITIDEANPLPTYDITLNEQKRAANVLDSLEDMIEDAKESVKEESKRNRQYTDRRFSSVQQTLSMLQAAFDEFSPGIDPVTVHTMTLVAGDPRGQFIFTASRQSTDPIPCPVYYDAATKQMKVDACALVHMTLGIDGLTAPGVRTAGDYFSWNVKADESEVLDEGDISYYVCIKAKKDGTDAELFLTPEPIDLEVDGYYYFYVGVLNSESGGTRDFATIYGFTEVAPGRIVTNVIRSADGTCVFDLENNTITGPMRFLPGTTGIENIEGLTETIQNSVGGLEFGKYNLLRNSGFTGDFLSESLEKNDVLSENKQMFSDPFTHWMHVNATVQDSEVSESGKMCVITSGVISQQLETKLIIGESYVLSFRAIGSSLTYSVGGVSKTIPLTGTWTRYVEKFTAASDGTGFAISNADCAICEIQLERGNVVSAWGHNMRDNQSELAKYQSMQYLEAAIKNGNTDIIGGLIMSNLLLLGNPGASDNNAGISGIRNDDNDVAFWGGGTYAQAIATVMKYVEDPTYQPTDAEVASMAKAVITHGGRAILNDIILRGAVYSKSGKLGNLNITEEGIEVNTEQGGKVVINPSGIILYGRDGNISGTIGYCGGSAISAVGRGGIGSCPSDEEKVGVYASSAKSAFFCNKGRFVGLRTATRVISESGGTTADNPRNQITEFDTNILVNMTSGTCYINILNTISNNEIEDGQEYIIETMGASLNITTGSDNIYSIYSGRYFGSASNPLTHTTRDVLRFKYYADAAIWTCTLISKTA